MDERRDENPSDPSVGLAADTAPVAAAGTPEPAPSPRKRGWKAPLGMTAALVLSFAWGALVYRELGATRVISSPPVAVAAVAGAQSPPGWIDDFASAFCAADAEYLSSHIGPPLDGQVEQIKQALASRDWSCAETRYLGGGANTKGEFYAYITADEGGGEQWWVFTVMGGRVVAIE